MIQLWQGFIIMIFILIYFIIPGCGDSGKEAVDGITGNRAVKQFHKSKEDIEKIADKQAEKYESILKDEEKDKDEEN
jgi:hypothetical protein